MENFKAPVTTGSNMKEQQEQHEKQNCSNAPYFCLEWEFKRQYSPFWKKMAQSPNSMQVIVARKLVLKTNIFLEGRGKKKVLDLQVTFNQSSPVQMEPEA